MGVAGVLGFGSAGRRHSTLLAERGYEVLVCDPAEDSAAAITDAGFTAVDENVLLSRSELVVVSSPNHEHAGQFAAALDAGADVLVEKPLAVSPTQAVERAVHDAAAAGRVLGVACNLRFVPAIETARKLVEEGRLGNVVRARADFGYDLRRWRPGRDYRTFYSARADQGGGVLLDAIHEFDYLYWLFGAVVSVGCIAATSSSLDIDVEDVAAAILRFESGVVGEVALDFVSPVYRRGFEIVGERAVATWRWQADAVTVAHGDDVETIPVAGPDQMYTRLIDDFLEARHDRRPPRTSGPDGLAVLRIADAARRAAETGTVLDLR